MQINEIQNMMLANAGKNNQINTSISGTGASESIKDHTKTDALRDISVKNPFYNKNELGEKTVSDALSEVQGSGLSAKELKEQMVLSSEHMTDEVYGKLSDDGHDPMDMEGKDFVTIADKIRVQLAKGGMDISMTGGVSDKAVEAMGGDAHSSAAIDKAVDNAMKKAAELNELSEDNMLYLVKNNLEPTIESLFAAEYSQGAEAVRLGPGETIDFSKPEMQALYEQVSSVITEADFEVDETQTKNAALLIESEIPVTVDTITYLNTLQSEELQLDKTQVVEAILTSLEEGKMPEDAYLMKGFSLKDQAIEINEYFQTTDEKEIAFLSTTEDQVVALRQVNEIRLMMTMEANYSLLKQGITIDTRELEELVENLKAYESDATVEQKVTEVLDAKEEVKGYPIALLGDFHTRESIENAAIPDLQKSGAALAVKYEAAGERYETMGTEVRRDLGDSIKKAFQNVDDILKDLGMDVSEENEKAVRILGYNSLEITEESVSTMRYANEVVQSAFKALTPKVVTQMIKEGFSPLDSSLKELQEKAKEITANMKDSSGEFSQGKEEDNFAKFLWKLERQNGITEEQRQSYIGVYRLLHQVEASDGAVIGQLMNQGADLTLRNMMGAVRTRKHENREYSVDDNFGGVDNTTSSLSITQQIEAAFFTSRVTDAKDAISPSKMMQFENEDSYMNMNPDQFASALESMDEDEKAEKAYVQEEITRMQTAVSSEEKVYQMLQQMDLPTTPAYLEAWNQYLTNRNQLFKNLAKNINGEREVFSEIGSDLDFSDLDGLLQTTMEDIIEVMGEASKTPEEMAEAQEKLAETAENVMRNMIVEKDVSSIDIRGMKITVKQLQMLGKQARKTEQYAVPIMVADEYGNLSLKIVRGKDEDKGQVDITFDMESTGVVSAAFKYEGNSLDGTITASSQATREMLSAHMGLLAQAMQREADLPVALSFGWENDLDANSIYEDKEYDFEVTTEKRQIQTSKLYGIARAFIQTLGEIAS